MYHPRLYGDFYDMGHTYGSLLRNKTNFKLPEISHNTKEFGKASIPVLKRFYPEILDEINGFADGINECPNNVSAFLLSLVDTSFSAQCSVFAFRNDASVVVGRNYDMPIAFKKFTESSLIAPTNKFSYIAQSDVFIGRSDGINEKGLFIAMSFVNGKTLRPGVSFHFVIRKVLENAQSTGEAVALIKEAQVSSSNNFIVADRQGDIVVVESTPEKKNVLHPSKGRRYLHMTNQFVSKQMRSFDRGGIAWSKSEERYHGLLGYLATANEINMVKAKEILSDSCVCFDLKKEKFATIWSVAANLNTLTIQRAETKPKMTNFKVDPRLNWWLGKKEIVD